jgi:hypothetical protein
VNEEEWSYNPQGFPLRTLRSVELFDVGPVTFPAYLGTDVTFARAMESVCERAGRVLTLDDLMPKRTVVTPNTALRMRLDLMRRVLGH